jgi:hypothetical protein
MSVSETNLLGEGISKSHYGDSQNGVPLRLIFDQDFDIKGRKNDLPKYDKPLT